MRRAVLSGAKVILVMDYHTKIYNAIQIKNEGL